MSLVLASASRVRRTLLEQAGLAVAADPADIDEAPIKKAAAAAGQSAGRAALDLALAKAFRVAARHPGALVLGADQILDCAGRWFDKPVGRQGAKAQLLALAGKPHHLATAAVLVRDETALWECVEMPRLVMRALDGPEVEAYLDRAGPDVTSSVGAYQLEGIGIQLFDAIEGDYFAILGLPLLPLLVKLRAFGRFGI